MAVWPIRDGGNTVGFTYITHIGLSVCQSSMNVSNHGLYGKGVARYFCLLVQNVAYHTIFTTT